MRAYITKAGEAMPQAGIMSNLARALLPATTPLRVNAQPAPSLKEPPKKLLRNLTYRVKLVFAKASRNALPPTLGLTQEASENPAATVAQPSMYGCAKQPLGGTAPAMARTSQTLALTLALTLAASARAESLLLTGADLYPVAAAPIMAGDLLIRDGKIAGIGSAGSLDAGDARRVDYKGKRIYPGLIHANSVLGLTEIEAVRATNDFQEVGSLNANARAEVAINPDSELIPVTRNNGIVAVHVAPQGTGALFTGQSAVVQLSGWTWEQMNVRSGTGVHLMWPSARLPEWLPPAMLAEARKTLADNLKAIQDIVADARRYATQAAGQSEPSASDLRLAAMGPVLARKQRLFVHAEELTGLRQALEFCRKETLDCVLVGASDGWRLAKEIAEAKVPVILSSPFTLPARRHEGFDAVYRNAARLHEAGVSIAIAGDGTSFAAALDKNLAHHAAQTVAYGLPAEVALRAITLDAAGVLGVADRLGSLELHKDASVIVTDGDPLELTTRVEAVYIRGILQSADSRHERLYQRYRQRIEP